jgi:hypothetical protein
MQNSFETYDPVTDDMSDLKKGNRRVLWLTCGVFAAVFLLIFLCAAFIFGMMAFLFGSMKSSTPYQDAMTAVQSNADAILVLGEPIKPGFLLSGNINLNGNEGEASLQIPVSGPGGKGTVYVEAQKYDNAWHYSRMELLVDGRAAPIPLLTEKSEK